MKPDLNVSLSSLALLSLRMEEGNDYLDYLKGFVVEALHQIKSPSFDATALQAMIEKEFGLRIPVATLAIYLKRLQKARIVESTPDGYQFRIKDLPQSSIANDRKAATGRINEVLQKLKEYAIAKYHSAWDENQTAAALTEFVQKYSIAFVRHTEFRSPLPEPGGETASDHFIVASFIKDCAAANPVTFESIKTLVESHILANALLCPDLKDKGTGFKNVTFVLDTRLLLKAFDLEAVIDTTNTRGLLESARKLGGVLCVFPETKDEIRAVLNGIKRGFLEGGARGPLVEELRYRGRGVADVILAESKLEENLKKLHISTLPSPPYDTHTYRFQIDEVGLRAELEEELGYMLGKAADHDVHVVRSIFALRKGRHVSRIEDCGYVFLTTNAALSRAAFNQQKEETTRWIFSTVITDFHLSHLVWLKNPTQAGDLSRTELLSSCYAAMRPSQNVWKAYITEVDRLKAEGQFTEQDHEVLRLSLKAPNELMEVTKGQIEGITEANLKTILNRLEKTYATEKDKEISDLRLQQGRIQQELESLKKSAEKGASDLNEVVAREKALQEQKSATELEIARLKAAYDELVTRQETTNKSEERGKQNTKALKVPKRAIPDTDSTPRWVLPTVVVFGVVFVLVLLAVAIFIPNPTKFQEFVFRVVLSLAAAGVGAALPGFLHVKMPLWSKGLISAGGALAMFVLVYRINPPSLLTGSSNPASNHAPSAYSDGISKQLELVAVDNWIKVATQARESGAVSPTSPLPHTLSATRTAFESWWAETPLSIRQTANSSNLFAALSLNIWVYRKQEIEDKKKPSSFKWANEAVSFFEETANQKYLAQSLIGKAAIYFDLADIKHTDPAAFQEAAKEGEAIIKRAAELAGNEEKADAFRMWSSFYYNLARPQTGNLTENWDNTYLLRSYELMRTAYSLATNQLKNINQLARVTQKTAANRPQDADPVWTGRLWEVQYILKSRWAEEESRVKEWRSRVTPLNILSVLTMGAVLKEWSELSKDERSSRAKSLISELDSTALPAQREAISLVMGTELEESHDFDLFYDLARMHSVRLLIAEFINGRDVNDDFNEALLNLKKAKKGATDIQREAALDSLKKDPCFTLLSKAQIQKMEDVLRGVR